MKSNFLVCFRWWQTYFRYNESKLKSALDTISRYLTPDIVIFLAWLMSFSIAVSPILGWSYYHPETNGFTYVKKELVFIFAQRIARILKSI